MRQCGIVRKIMMAACSCCLLAQAALAGRQHARRRYIRAKSKFYAANRRADDTSPRMPVFHHVWAHEPQACPSWRAQADVSAWNPTDDVDLSISLALLPVLGGRSPVIIKMNFGKLISLLDRDQIRD